jgi:hypothetical protein
MRINRLKLIFTPFLIIALATMSLSACKSSKSAKGVNTTNPPSNPLFVPTTSPFVTSTPAATATPGGSADCDEPGIGSSNINYYSINNINLHGAQAVGPSDPAVWSSATHPSLQGTANQSIFITDTTFNVRIKLLPSNGQGYDTFGNYCAYDALPYQKFRITMRLNTSTGGAASNIYTFENVPVNGCSDVYEFPVPNTTEPLQLELLQSQWDYSCTSLIGTPYENDGSVCPYYPVWIPDCYQIGVQFSTDYTKDIPH